MGLWPNSAWIFMCLSAGLLRHLEPQQWAALSNGRMQSSQHQLLVCLCYLCPACSQELLSIQAIRVKGNKKAINGLMFVIPSVFYFIRRHFAKVPYFVYRSYFSKVCILPGQVVSSLKSCVRTLVEKGLNCWDVFYSTFFPHMKKHGRKQNPNHLLKLHF